MKLLTKILLIIEYHTYASFGASTEYYKEHREKQAGIGQGYIVLVSCWDSLYLFIREVKNEILGVMINSLILKEKE